MATEDNDIYPKLKVGELAQIFWNKNSFANSKSLDWSEEAFASVKVKIAVLGLRCYSLKQFGGVMNK